MTNEEATPISVTTVYTVRDEVQFTVVEGEAVIVDLRSDAYFTLSPSATQIWEAVHAGGDLESAAGRLIDGFDVEPERARREAAAFIHDLVGSGLIEVKAG